MRRAISLLWPLPLVPVTGFAITEGWLNLGGGEKDIILVLPLAAFAIVYLFAALLLWVLRVAPAAAALRATLAAFLFLLVMWGTLFVLVLMGARMP
jgi:hypothetical protein